MLASLPPLPEPPDNPGATAVERPAADPDDPATLLTPDRLPPPKHFYALDGTISLVRSRFLHLYLDLQQREAVFAPAGAPEVIHMPRGLRTMPTAPPGDAVGADPAPTAFRVFSMEQSRQVRTGQVEYFDGPVLGVLAYVTEIEPAVEAD